jgi:hypothetical protein
MTANGGPLEIIFIVGRCLVVDVPTTLSKRIHCLLENESGVQRFRTITGSVGSLNVLLEAA